jgi:mannose-6-phosphate isomerase
MIEIYKLQNQIKHYEWGSLELLPRFLGLDNSQSLPWAEMWMGTHCGAPSQVFCGDGLLSLAQVAEGELPFLFKLLAVEKPLSLQAHPNSAQASVGFRRENEAGIALDAAERNYKDENHKPEILCAVTPFTVMAGFREPEEISCSLNALRSFAPSAEKPISVLLRALAKDSSGEALKDFLRCLFQLSKQERQSLCECIIEKADGADSGITAQQFKLMRDFAIQYPADAAVISPLFLNLFTLQPFQAVFLPAGILHTYISGFGFELMASSDNVLRGGLTPKHVDAGELMNILEFRPFLPPVLSPSGEHDFRYPASCDGASLSIFHGRAAEKIFPEKGPALCVVTEGELSAGEKIFKKGESFFIPRSAGQSVFSGNYTLFAAGASEGAQL